MAKVILDAGHGGYDNGAVYNARTEKADNLNLALAVGRILANNGVDVEYTRTNDVYQNPNEKARIANASGADYFVSFHRNSSPIPNMYEGVQTLIYDDSGNKAELGNAINQNLAELGFKNLGNDIRKDLVVLRRTNMPAVLIETGFINTDKDNAIYDSRFNEIAQAIADGILETINPSLKSQGDEEKSTPSTKLYVQTGLFRNPSNAKALQEQLKKDGYESKIVPMNQYVAVLTGGFYDMASARRLESQLIKDGYETWIITL